jgi:hypothetical protein
MQIPSPPGGRQEKQVEENEDADVDVGRWE